MWAMVKVLKYRINLVLSELRREDEQIECCHFRKNRMQGRNFVIESNAAQDRIHWLKK